MWNNRVSSLPQVARILGPAVVAWIALVSCTNPMTDNPGPPLRKAPDAGSQRVTGEYIVTMESETPVETLLKIYEDFGVLAITDLGTSHYLIKLKSDPGVAAIEKKGIESGKIKAVQPNFIYRIQRP